MFYEHSGYCSLTLIWSLTDAAANKQKDEQQQLLHALLRTKSKTLNVDTF